MKVVLDQIQIKIKSIEEQVDAIESDFKEKMKAATSEKLKELADLLRDEKAEQFLENVCIKNDIKTQVQSATDKNVFYNVNIKKDTCDCPDQTHRKLRCWHIRASILAVENKKSENRLGTNDHKVSSSKEKSLASTENDLIRKDLLD